MRYLGIDIKKPRIAVFDFTCCEGCELQLANKEDTLLCFLSQIEIVNFRLVSSEGQSEYDIAIVEGSISRADEIERLKKIREKAKILVAMGTCATFGGVNALKNRFGIEAATREVYGDRKVDTLPVRPVSDFVKVDFEIPGCPVSKAEVEKIVLGLVLGSRVSLPKYPVCVECKQQLNTCVVELGKVCLGAVTRAGCGSPCPAGKTGCWGCRGPVPDANIDGLRECLREKGFTDEEVQERFDFYNAFSGESCRES